MKSQRDALEHRKLAAKPQASVDLSAIEISQDVANCSVLLYGAAEDFDPEKMKCGQITKVGQNGEAIMVTFSNQREATKAVKKFHGKDGIVAFKDYAAPILATGHKPDLYILRDVPEEISIPDLWSALSGDEIKIRHMSFLPMSTRQCMIHSKEHDALLGKNGTRLKKWRIKVELWTDFCFSMTRQNVVLIEDLPKDSSVDDVKELLGVQDGLKYVEVIEDYKCALVYCQTKPIVDQVMNCNQSNLKFSLYKQVAGYQHLVVVNNLHETTKVSDVFHHFQDCEISKLNLTLDSRKGGKRAVVYLKDEVNFSKALNYHGSELLGHTLSVTPKFETEPKEVFITDLHRATTALQLCLKFQDCGHIENVYVPKQKKIVNFQEAAFIVFRDTVAVQKALAKTGEKFRGRRFVVHKDDPYDGLKKRKKSDGQNNSEIEGGSPSKRKIEDSSDEVHSLVSKKTKKSK